MLAQPCTTYIQKDYTMSDQIQSAPAQSTSSSAPAESLQPQNSNSQFSAQDSTQVAEAKEAVAQASTPEEKAAAIKYLSKLQLKVDGKVLEEELPFDIPEDPEVVKWMTSQLQLAKMAQNRAREKSNLEKDVEQFFGALRKDPRSVLLDPSLGLDMDKIVQEYMEQKIQDSQKSPEQLEKEKLEKEIKKIREEREKEKEEFQKKELERLQEQEFNRYDNLMSKALESSDLPKSPYVVKKIADYMLLGLENGFDVNPEDVLPMVKEEIYDDLKSMFQVMPSEVIEKVLGKDIVGKIRKSNIQKVRSAGGPSKPAPSDTGNSELLKSAKPAEPQKKMSIKDFLKV